MSLSLLSKKWVLPIVMQLMDGRKRYSDLLEELENISGKVLSERLKELSEEGIITKIILNAIPLKVKYLLTDKGRTLNRIMFELSVLAGSLYPEKVFNKKEVDVKEVIKSYGTFFEINEEEISERLNYLEE
ncbi:MAG: winged helix-turn-helix transcriptional regulator [Candidatus Kariarchaeaceae archaeon]|jgi:DNA-binding HxlR family transcriptional regulator